MAKTPTTAEATTNGFHDATKALADFRMPGLDVETIAAIQRKNLEAQILQSRKLEAVGRLASAPYEFEHHVEWATKAGISAEQIDGIAASSPSCVLLSDNACSSCPAIAPTVPTSAKSSARTQARRNSTFARTGPPARFSHQPKTRCAAAAWISTPPPAPRSRVSSPPATT